MGVGTNTTYFVGSHYEVTNGTVTKYYYAGSQRVAMRTNGTLNYLLGDHLGSTSLTTDASGVVISELRYKAWGETRYALGTSPTKYTFTGQYSYAGDFGLHFYNARWYDSSLSRFAQADTIVPGGVQGLDRYAYVNNAPINYTDPTGHRCAGGGDENIWGYCELPTPDKVKTFQNAYLNAVARKYGIKLAPGDKWEYIEFVGVEPGASNVRGWTPYRPQQPYFDSDENLKYADDSSVVATEDAFDSCGNSMDCLAGILAHEATHSWIEMKIESAGVPEYDRVSNFTPAEEMLASLVAMEVGDPMQIQSNYLGENTFSCQQLTNTPCANPLEMLESYYGIDLSDIYDLVFGR